MISASEALENMSRIADDLFADYLPIAPEVRNKLGDLQAMFNYVTTLSGIHNAPVYMSTITTADGDRHISVSIGQGKTAIGIYGTDDDLNLAWSDPAGELHTRPWDGRSDLVKEVSDDDIRADG